MTTARSFRLGAEALLNLDKVADHLARTSGKPRNLTTALTWALAQGVTAVEQAEGRQEKLPDTIRGQLGRLVETMKAVQLEWEAELRRAPPGSRMVTVQVVDAGPPSPPEFRRK